MWSKKTMNRIHNINKKANKGAKKLLYQSNDDAVIKVKCGRKKAQSPTTTIAAIPDGETDDTLDEQKKGVIGAVFKGVTWLKISKEFNGHNISHQKEKYTSRKYECVGTCEGIPALGIQLWGWGKCSLLWIPNTVFINLMFAVYEVLTSVPSQN